MSALDCKRCWNFPCTCGHERPMSPGGPTPADYEALQGRVAELERRVELLLGAHPKLSGNTAGLHGRETGGRPWVA